MSEFRQDPITGEWVLIAPERAGRDWKIRPTGFDPPDAAGTRPCPFCPAHWTRHPEEHLRLVLPGTDGPWGVLVVANRYPAVSEATPPAPPPADGLLRRHPGWGIHELVIETPHHDRDFATMSPGEVNLVLRAWQARAEALGRRPGVAAVTVFRNSGGFAGASLTHPHSQIVAMPLLPQRMERQQAAVQAYRAAHGRALFADLVAREREEGTRLVFEHGGLVACQPYAARWPYETWLLPARPAPPFEALEAEALANLGRACQRALRTLGQSEGPFSYNLLLNLPPAGQDGMPWWVQLVPRFVMLAGFEFATGVSINPVAPEDCAARLRAAYRTLYGA